MHNHQKKKERKENERRTISKQACAGTLVQPHKTEVAHDPYGRAPGRIGNGLGHLALDLQSDLDNLERVGEDLADDESCQSQSVSRPELKGPRSNSPPDRHQQFRQPEARAATRSGPSACRCTSPAPGR